MDKTPLVKEGGSDRRLEWQEGTQAGRQAPVIAKLRINDSCSHEANRTRRTLRQNDAERNKSSSGKAQGLN